MRAPCFPDSTCHEAIQLTRDEAGGSITVTLRLNEVSENASNDMLTLLSCWWLRWIAALDCAFFQDEEGWQMHCRLEPTDHAMLSQVLRDMLAIKNSVCL